MTYAITVKNYVTATKTRLEHVQALIGHRTDCELSPNDGVSPAVATGQCEDNPSRHLVGIGIRRRPTAEIMRETRGDDSMR